MLRAKMQPKLLNVNRIPGQPKRRKKITVVFDEEKRREYLEGFHKRKVQRRKKAQEELQQQLKEERKKIKREVRERYKNLLSDRDIPEIQELLSQQEYETEGHTISILELNVADLAEKNTFIGENKGISEEECKDEEQSDKNSEENKEIIGMSLSEKKKKDSNQTIKDKQIANKKDFKRAIKNATLKQMKKSKAFQRIQKIESQKNKRENMRKRKRLEKFEKRNRKFRKKSNQ